MKRIHLCLVSGQPIPNLIPLRMAEFSPEKVILIVSADMTLPATRMKRIIHNWGIAVEERPVDPYNIDNARNTFLEILADLDGKDVTLNVTGGTKIMALAAFEVFREMRKPIIYTDTQGKRVQMLSPHGDSVPFRNVIKIKPYLASYGQNIIAGKRDRSGTGRFRLLTKSLVNGIHEYSDAIRLLNKHIVPLREGKIFPANCALEQDAKNDRFAQLLQLCETHGALTTTDNGNTLVLPDHYAVEFLSGGWLEEYAFDVVASLSPLDLMMSVKVEWDLKGRKPPKNEYDVVFTHENRLYLIECKTKRFVGADRKDESDDPIYKLDSLKEAAGGLFGKGILVSYQKLTATQKERLSANRLEYCDGPSLKTLRDKIVTWIA